MELRISKAFKISLSVVLALLLGTGVIGLALLPASSRAVTVWGVERFSQPVSWLSEEEMSQAAQAVWGFSVKGDPATLPQEISGHEAFPADQVEHLAQVNSILNITRFALIGVLIAAAALIPLYLYKYGIGSLGATIAVTGGVILIIIAVVGIAAAIDFGSFFDLFHRVLFPAGTWVFSGDSLLISCFPEPFWVFLGVIWLAGIVLLSVAMLVFGIFTKSRS